LNDQKSFKEQISQILDVKAKYPHNVFPFMVVDPRRPGILEMVKIFVGQGKPFAGVKLYAPNGYSPTDPLLYGKEGDTDCIYQFCIDNDLPITAHNSAGGFATFVTNLEVKGLVFKNNLVQELNGWVHFDTDFLNDGKEAIKERANTLNHPLIWAEVLKKFPTLRLDLAHFGAGDVNWSNEIFKLLSERDENNKLKYTNLHSDLSCFTKQEIEFNKTNYYDKAPADVKAKFLYGSDYYLNMIASNNFSEYYRNFISVFGQADFDKISIHNPAKYLNNKEIYKLLA
jgi:predicted TIM-barrel fold metal-dependent hydrolase